MDQETEQIIPSGSYLEGVNDCLEIVEQVLGLTPAGSVASDFIATIHHRINNELV